MRFIAFTIQSYWWWCGGGVVVVVWWWCGGVVWCGDGGDGVVV